MSIQAVSWAFGQEIARSSVKFVLVALANYADQKGFCYPSQKRLSRDTGQDRKTIIASLKALTDLGLLRDSGKRIGATSSVIIYQIVGLPESATVHYVYRITNQETGEFYIGKRSFDGDPELDIYRGSSDWVMRQQASDAVLIRSVLSLHETSEEAISAEIAEMRRVDGDPLCKNLQLPSLQRSVGLASYQRALQDVPKTVHVPKTDTEGVPFSDMKMSQKRYTEPLFNLQYEPSAKELLISSPIDDWPPDYVDQFWIRYPRRVGKLSAVKSLDKARKSGVRFETIISAIGRIQTKDAKFIPHPATWLNRGGWDDEYESTTPANISVAARLAQKLKDGSYHGS